MAHRLQRRLCVLTVLAIAATAASEESSYLYVAPEDLDGYWVATRKVAPRYPREALERGLEGCVSLAFVVESDGRTSHHVALAVSPSMVFTRSAIKAVKKSRFAPGKENTKREPVLTFETFSFTVNLDRSRTVPIDKVALSATCSEAAVKQLGGMGGEDSG